MRKAIALTVIAALLFSGGVGAQPLPKSLQSLTSAEVASLPVAGGRIGVVLKPGRAFDGIATFSAEIVDVKEPSTFIGRLKPGEHILAVQSYSFANQPDMIRYIGSLPPKSPVQLLVSDKNENLRIVTGQLINVNQIVADAPSSPAAPPTVAKAQSAAAGPLVVAKAQAVPVAPPKEETSCVKEAGKGVAVALVGTAILVGLDCIFLACVFTTTAIATSAGAVTAGTIAIKGATIAAAGAATGCAKGMLD